MARWTFLRSVAAAAALSITAGARGDLVVGGDIVSNVTWTLGDSPIVVTSSVTVKSNATLTIEAGVEVRFSPGTRLRVGPPGSVGALIARGTADAPIRLTAGAFGLPGSWTGILFDASAADALFNTQGYLAGCIFEHCVVEFAGGDTALPGAIRAVSSYPYFNSCEVRMSATSGIDVAADSGGLKSVRIEHCWAHHNLNGAGIRISGAKDHVVTDCLIEANENGGGLSMVAGGTVANCTMTDNSGGNAALYAYASGTNSLLIDNCTVSDNPTMGMDVTGANALVRDCTVSGNVGFFAGGILQSGGLIESCLISGNTSAAFDNCAGGVRGQADIKNCTIVDNVGGVGGVYFYYGGSLESSTVSNNIALTGGGGLRIDEFEWDHVTVVGNEIENNSSAEKGGGVLVNGGANLAGNFIRNNSAQVSGGGLHVASIGISLAGEPDYVNANTITGNMAPLGAALSQGAGSAAVVDASWVDWGTIDPASVLAGIHDFLDDGALGLVITTPIPSPIITMDTTWDRASSPWIIEQSVLVTGGATLTIDPGVAVLFGTGIGLTAGHATYGSGAIVARGTAQSPIRFTSGAGEPGAGDWAGIQFTDGSIDATLDSEDNYLAGSVLEACIVEYGGSGPKTLAGAVTVQNAAPLLRDCEIAFSTTTGLYLESDRDERTSVLVDGCFIHHNIDEVAPNGMGNAGGIVIDGGTGHRVLGCTVADNTGVVGGGVVFRAASDCVLDGCTITANTGVQGAGLLFDPSQTPGDIHITNNLIAYNTATGSGGGFYSIFVPVELVGNRFVGNTAVVNGAGQIRGDNVVFRDNVVSGNIATATEQYSAGGFSVESDGAIVADNVFTANSGYTGALHMLFAVGSTISGNTFVGNVATHGGGAMRIRSHQAQVNGNVIRANTAPKGGGVYVELGGAPNLSGDPRAGVFNTIVDNVAEKGSAVYDSRQFVVSGSTDIFAQHVCWGTTDVRSVAAMIYDHADDPSLSVVHFRPVATECAAPVPDLDGDGDVDAVDLSVLLGAWGPCPPGEFCLADLDVDGSVTASDLAIMLAGWTGS